MGFLVSKLKLPNNTFTEILILTSRFIAFSKTKVTLNKQEISVNRNSIVGLTIKPNFILPYSEIYQHSFNSDMHWYWLKIINKNGKVYRIWRFIWINNKRI